jgi:hypothetical protein
MRSAFFSSKRSSKRAAALIVVLAFVVLLTGLAVAYLSRATTDRQLAHTSFHDTDADLLARSALDSVVGDFRQEIVNGSTKTPVTLPSGISIYVPKATAGSGAAANMIPQRNNVAATIPNLIRRSLRSETPFWPDTTVGPAVGSRASAVNSHTDVSANGRSISLAKWNSHYLITRQNPADTTYDSTPINSCDGCSTDTGFIAPDWVFVKAYDPVTKLAGPAVISAPDASVVGRYAYAVYDEGGLLDINVAGYPIPSTAPASWTTDIGRKGVLAFADLTALPATTNDPPNAMTSTAINQAILFRNYATSQTSSVTLSDTATVIADAFNSGASLFANYYLGSVRIGTSQDFGSVNPTKIGTGSSIRTDQNFATRAELIALFHSGSSLPQNINALQYLGTFSREKNQPTLPLTPACGDVACTVKGWPSTSPRVVLPQRFYLGNLSEVVSGGNAANIRTFFGLQFSSSGGLGSCDNQVRWKYVGQGTNTIPLLAIPAFPSDLTTLDFFQYMNYALFGVTGSDSTDIPFTLGIGAALIDEYDADASNTGIYYGSSTNPNCDSITACVVYGPEQTGATVAYPTPSCISPLPPVPQVFTGSLPPFNVPFRTVGDFGWAYSILNAANNRNINTNPNYVIDFKDPYDSTSNPDPALLDFFTYNNANVSPPAYSGAPVRSGTVSLNTRQLPVLTAILKGAFYKGTSGALSQGQASNAANSIVNDATNGTIIKPAMSRADISRLVSAVIAAGIDPFSASSTQDTDDVIARALSETTQTRTWGLLIDLVAQTGHYAPNATGLADFVVEGEKRYWLHIAIDRFDGTIVGQQLEEVTE